MRVTINPAQPSNDDMESKASLPFANAQEVFKPETLVQHRDDTKFIISVIDGVPHNEDYFCGVVLQSGEVNLGMRNEWQKRYFVKFVGNVVLEQ